MVRSLANRPGGHTRMSRAHADAKATEAAVPEATEAATAAARARRRARRRCGIREQLAAAMTRGRSVTSLGGSSLNARSLAFRRKAAGRDY